MPDFLVSFSFIFRKRISKLGQQNRAYLFVFLLDLMNNNIFDFDLMNCKLKF